MEPPDAFELDDVPQAAFVSSYALDRRTGLSQGFQTYHYDFAPGPPSLSHIALFRCLIRGWMAFGDPASTPWLLERQGDVTNGHLLRWLDDRGDVPCFA